MEYNNRKSVNTNLRRFDYLAEDKDFIEVTEWVNGEGYDVTINNKAFSFTEGEIEAIYYLVKSLQYPAKK